MGNTLKGRRIVVTGCSRGVGFETSKQLLAQGAEVLGVARDEARLAQSTEILSVLGAFTSVQADVADPKAGETIAAAAAKRWPAIDVLLNNAGVQTYNTGWQAEEPGLLERDLHVNVLGPHRIAKALLPMLLKGIEPRLINTSSGAGQRKVVEESVDMPAYRISKLTLNALTIMQANDLKGKVAVNSLDPGWLRTDLGGPTAPGAPSDGADCVLQLLDKPFTETGKFWHGKDQIEF